MKEKEPKIAEGAAPWIQACQNSNAERLNKLESKVLALQIAVGIISAAFIVLALTHLLL